VHLGPLSVKLRGGLEHDPKVLPNLLPAAPGEQADDRRVGGDRERSPRLLRSPPRDGEVEDRVSDEDDVCAGAPLDGIFTAQLRQQTPPHPGHQRGPIPLPHGDERREVVDDRDAAVESLGKA